MATILIVDDQPDNLYVLERLLRRQGYQVVQAERGEQALELARREPPDLILLDVMMPGMDGFEVVRHLRGDPATQSTPVILLTANAPDHRLKIQGLNLGADEYLTQPINNSELVARIRALLRTKQVQDDLLALNGQLRALLDVLEAGASSLDLATVGQRLVDGAVRAAAAQAGCLWLVEDETLVCLAQTGYRAEHAPQRRALGAAPNDVFRRVILDLETVHGTPAALGGDEYQAEQVLKTAILLPVIHRQIAIGVLQLAMVRTRDFSPDDLHFLGALANAAASSVQNARLFEETDRQRQRLEALDNEKDEFISVITHELKNPLASIKGYAGLLARRARKDPNLAAATKAMDVIQQQVTRMTMLLDQLRDVSHIGINRFAVEPQNLDLVQIVQHVATDAQTTTSDHTIKVDVRDPVIRVWGDEFRMEQVLSNLVGNAIKYSPEGGRVELVVGCGNHVQHMVHGMSVPSDWAVVLVRDYGIGIPAAERERLFERFFRATNAKGNVSGMGLGLYIAREIIQRHGGTMWVESEEGQGSLFGIALPPVPGADGTVNVHEEQAGVLLPSESAGS